MDTLFDYPHCLPLLTQLVLVPRGEPLCCDLHSCHPVHCCYYICSVRSRTKSGSLVWLHLARQTTSRRRQALLGHSRDLSYTSMGFKPSRRYDFIRRAAIVPTNYRGPLSNLGTDQSHDYVGCFLDTLYQIGDYDSEEQIQNRCRTVDTVCLEWSLMIAI